MSIYTALNVGVSGVQSQSTNISVISDNIANVDTTGYKSSVASFESLINNDKNVVTYSPSGVDTDILSLNSLQGAVTPTTSTTDVAISGNGFFAVSQNSPATPSDILYTRAGSFTPNQNGDFVNSAGFFLQAWPVDSSGNLPASLDTSTVNAATATGSLVNVNPNSLSVPAIATTTVALQATLNAAQAIYAGTPAYDATSTSQDMASGVIAPQFTIPAQMFDNQGVAHTVNIGFLKTGNNTWAAEIYPKTASDITAANPQLAAGTITFNNDGTLASVSPSLSGAISIPWSATGTSASSVTYDWGTAGSPFGTPGATVIGRSDGLSQFATPFNLTSITQNGIAGGKPSSVAINSNGDIVGTFKDGSSRNLYKIPLATFTDPDQLTSLSGNVFQPSADSSAPSFEQPDSGAAGALVSSALESSNVDISSQLTTMIIAQRAYQANTKTISTSDEMMQTLTQMGTT